MDSPIVVTAYYVQNMIQLIGPNQTSKILDKLRNEKMFQDDEENVSKLSSKIAKDGKKVVLATSFAKIENGIDVVTEKTHTKNITKKAFDKTKGMVKKVGTRTLVGIIGKKVPVLSAGVGTGLALWRILENPHSEEAWIKAGAEVASGTASCFPGVGTAVSLTIDGILVASDLDSAAKKEAGEKSENEQSGKHKKRKIPIPCFYSIAYQGKDVCKVSTLSQRFRVPENFEIWFFCPQNSVLSNYVQVDVLFYNFLVREAALQKINYTDGVVPSNCCEKLLPGDLCNDYKISLVQNDSHNSLYSSDFYLGLTKWAPKSEPVTSVCPPIEEEGGQYFTLSQLVCDLGRKENFGQHCVLQFLCDRAENSDDQLLSEKVDLWKERVKQLIPSVPQQ